ncbi:PucR family transcriptional regulator [Mycobacterium gastri]|uniref:PucR family transcriptional regulator n=1 Tax=Mycobacterium gastri TaxID=1777 RepID=A0A1X1W1F2_MYCGS|nr:helix-turn-helix domain-containing protein [Mycobacterium gastri]ETW26750.1 hypothetical protein MGAST_17330 [Mycobacterium gastri 'Wayne']ORV79865.1 hypothetical protein AWC07_22105 [Mycobacterium gastri]
MPGNRVGPTPEIASIAKDLSGRIVEVGDELLELVLATVPHLRGDHAVEALLSASLRENVAIGLDVIANAIDAGSAEIPTAAAEYARRLAQRGVPIEALLRAYRIGHFRFLELWQEELASRKLDASTMLGILRAVTEASFRYVDLMSENVLAVYQGERDRWLQNTSSRRASLIRSLLAGDDRSGVALGWELDTVHVGLVAWIDESAAGPEAPMLLDRAAAALATLSTRPPLTVVADESTFWAWFSTRGGAPIAAEALAIILGDAASGVRAAIGSPAAGPEGFRVTHEQALRAQAVAIASGSTGPIVTTFRETGLTSFLNADVAAARFWVEDVLGRLATDDDASARLRETSRMFLETNGSFTETAARLHLHKNTVLYRVRKAEELRGRALAEDRIGVEVALLACAWLGTAVLAPANGD